MHSILCVAGPGQRPSEHGGVETRAELSLVRGSCSHAEVAHKLTVREGLPGGRGQSRCVLSGEQASAQ